MSQVTESIQHSKNNPFTARLVENRLLSGTGSTKEVRHVVVDISGSGLTYTCGDSLGVYPTNRKEEVDEILHEQGWSGYEMVQLPKDDVPISIHEALSSRLALAGPTRRFLRTLLDRVTDSAERGSLEARLAPGAEEATAEYLDHRHFIDLLLEYPSARFSPQEFAAELRKLVPRLYSIASSPALYPDEVQLTVAVVRYETNGRDRYGVCSTYLGERAPLDQPTVPVFVAHSHFGLPENDDADIIMVGPGTGIAPFRGFIQERIARGAKGRMWLLFGDQRRACDFLYQDELEGWLRDGHLTRLDCAWSRDQEQKVYVQDRMREASAELWAWLENGAHFFVCGDAKRMARDVDAALHEIIATHGCCPEDEAAEYVKFLKKDKRYLRDVY